jgi:hypothetical protein
MQSWPTVLVHVSVTSDSDIGRHARASEEHSARRQGGTRADRAVRMQQHRARYPMFSEPLTQFGAHDCVSDAQADRVPAIAQEVVERTEDPVSPSVHARRVHLRRGVVEESRDLQMRPGCNRRFGDVEALAAMTTDTDDRQPSLLHHAAPSFP